MESGKETDEFWEKLGGKVQVKDASVGEVWNLAPSSSFLFRGNMNFLIYFDSYESSDDDTFRHFAKKERNGMRAIRCTFSILTKKNLFLLMASEPKVSSLSSSH